MLDSCNTKAHVACSDHQSRVTFSAAAYQLLGDVKKEKKGDISKTKRNQIAIKFYSLMRVLVEQSILVNYTNIDLIKSQFVM